MRFFRRQKSYLLGSYSDARLFHLFRLLIFAALILQALFRFAYAGKESESERKRKQIEQLETDLSREKEQFLKLGTREQSILGQLAEIERDIAGKREVLKSIKKELRLSRKELKARRRRLKHLEYELAAARERLGIRLIAFYKYAKRGYIQLLVTSRDFDQLRKRMKYLQVIMAEDQRLLREIAAVGSEMNQQIDQIKERLKLIHAMEEAEGERLLSIKEELDKKVFILMKIHREKEFYETLVKELQLAAGNLKKKLLDLERHPKTTVRLPSGFESSKGKLPLPFSGRIIRGRDSWGAEIVNTHKGIFIEGPLGAEVRAIFPGRVDFSGWLKGYGQTIIINHGSRFFTVSAHLSEREREEGNLVDKGTVIGLLGHTGPFSKSRLYFEIRKGGVPLDPLKWVKVN